MTLCTASFLWINLLVSSRFGEAMQLLREKLNQKNVYYMNPAFDM